MFTPRCVWEGKAIKNPEEDFRRAQRVEQYRLGEQALYIPAGLRWHYIPLDEIQAAEETHRSVTAGKCVAVTEKRPGLLLHAGGETFALPLEQRASLEKLLAAVGPGRSEDP